MPMPAPALRLRPAACLACILAAAKQVMGATNIISGGCCAYSYDASYDYFPDKASVDFSAGFTVEYFSSYKKVSITNRGEVYVLYQRGTPQPDEAQFAAGTVFIPVPIERAAVLSNAYFPYFELLGERKSMVVTTRHDYLADPCLQRMALEDGMLDGVTDRNLSASNPFATNNVDVIFRWSGSRDDDLTNTDPNLPAVVRVDTGAEVQASGFMEWIEYVSLFFNRELEASRMVSEMKARYDCIVSYVRLQPAVRVLYSSFSYSGGVVKCSFSDSTWHRRMINEVGGEVIGEYPGYESSEPCNMTAFREHAETADVWLYKSNNFQEGRYGSDWSVMWNFSSEIADVAPYRNGRTFDPNGNHFRDFWSSRIVQLDVELEDFVAIFHPGLGYVHEREYWLDVKTEVDPGRPDPNSCTCKYGAMQLKGDACPGNPHTSPQGNLKPESDYGCDGASGASACEAHPMGVSSCGDSKGDASTTSGEANTGEEANGSWGRKPSALLALWLLALAVRFA